MVRDFSKALQEGSGGALAVIVALSTLLGSILTKVVDWARHRSHHEGNLRRDMLSRLHHLEKSVTRMGEDLASWRDRYYALQKRYSGLEVEYTRLEATHADLEVRYQEATCELKELRTHIKELEQKHAREEKGNGRS